MSHCNRRIALFAALAAVGACVIGWVASEIIPRSRYGYASHRINAKIDSLRNRRPPNIDATHWEECVNWAMTAHVNICFSEGHTKYTEMRRFEADLDEKLKGAIGPEIVKWLFDRLATTGPTGERYIIRFRKHWTEALDAVAE